MVLTLGVDDAGRGPVIGPMILAGVLLSEDQKKILKKHNIRDSKVIFHKQRVKMAKIIKENCLSFKIVKSSAKEIDKSINTGTNLNKLEAIKTAEIINSLNKGKQRIGVIVDCPSSNAPAWKRTLSYFIRTKSNINLKCEHKADAKYISVSAASIIAKVAREEEVAKLKKQYAKYGNIGSGYPSDPTTKEFLKKHGKVLENSGLFRKTWATWKKLYPDKSQKTLGDF